MTLSLPVLVLIGAGGIGLLLVLIIRFKMQAFYALLVTSLVVGLAGGLPLTTQNAGTPDEQPGIVDTIISGVGGTLGSVAVLVALGAMLGKIVELSGGAEALANAFSKLLGPKRVGVALVAAASVLGIPVFFDAGFIILVPIIYAFAKRAGVNPVVFGLPVGATMLAIHVVVPPHPGIVAGSAIIGADVGLVTIVGLCTSAVLAVVAYFGAKLINRREYEMVGAAKEMFANFGKSGHPDFPELDTAKGPPAVGTVLAIILLPLVMIMAGTTIAPALPDGTFWNGALTLMGEPVFALIVALGVAMYVLGIRREWGAGRLAEVMDGSLPGAAVIILVTGAGGAFGKVLTATGIGDAIADGMAGLGLPVIVVGFLISVVLRAAQGSATVAIATAGGLMAPAIAALGADPLHVALIVVAIGYGGLCFCHVNASAFWIVTRYLGLSVKDGLRTWTPLVTTMGFIGFGLTAAAYALIPMS